MSDLFVLFVFGFAFLFGAILGVVATENINANSSHESRVFYDAALHCINVEHGTFKVDWASEKMDLEWSCMK